jgi:glycosyltransferase involved in cell wall biosynthesis
VVVPCYNYGNYLPSAVASALDQPGVDVEVIVVDDCSTDGSERVAATLATRHPEVRLIRNEVNKRHIATYNVGLSATTGDYVVLLSADDLVSPGALTRAAALMEASPSVGLVYGHVERFATEPPASPAGQDITWIVYDGRNWAQRLFRGGRCPLYSPEAVVRSSVMDRVGLYDPSLPHTGDLQMWARIAAVADVGYIRGCTQAFYRDHGLNMHSQVFEVDDAAGMVIALRTREEAFATAAPTLEGGDLMLRDAHEALAREALNLAARAYVWGLTDTWPIHELLAFARECDPHVQRRREWRVLRRRRRLGTRLSRKNPILVPRERFLSLEERRASARVRQVGLPV